MDAQCNINLDLIEPMAAHLSHSGVAAAFVGGSTGEGMSLTIPERKQLTEAWMAHGPVHGLGVIAQIGTNSQQEAIDLAEHAASLGVDAISAHAPCYFKPMSVADLIDYFDPIVKAAGDTPFYFYDIPVMTNVRVSTVDFLRQGRSRLSSLKGVKFTNNDIMQFQECLRLDDGAFEVWWGCDESIVAGYALGVKGAVGTTFNFMAPLVQCAIAAFDAGNHDQARKIQFKVIELIRMASGYSFLAVAKAIMKLHGLDCGPVRSPNRQLTDREARELLDAVSAMGFSKSLMAPCPPRTSLARTTLRTPLVVHLLRARRQGE
jgi:N-acetylneuraminate lyase